MYLSTSQFPRTRACRTAAIAALLALTGARPAMAAPAEVPAAGTPVPAVVASVPLAGPVRWDYVSADPTAHRVYLAHRDRVEVIDAGTRRAVGQLAPTPGVHGAAVDTRDHRVFTSDGGADAVSVFDEATGKRLATLPAGSDPDAIAYDAVTDRVFAFNGHSHDITAIDARTMRVLARSIAVGGTPEYAVSDNHGHVDFNVESTGEVAVLDARTLKLVRRYSLNPCQAPSGLAIDASGRLYSVCRNGLMTISDPRDGRILGQAPIGRGPDGVAWMDGRAYSANGRDGTLSVVAESAPGRFTTVATVPTALGARTIAADPARHELFTTTAMLAPGESRASPVGHRPAWAPGTFHLLVVSVPE